MVDSARTRGEELSWCRYWYLQVLKGSDLVFLITRLPMQGIPLDRGGDVQGMMVSFEGTLLLSHTRSRASRGMPWRFSEELFIFWNCLPSLSSHPGGRRATCQAHIETEGSESGKKQLPCAGASHSSRVGRSWSPWKGAYTPSLSMGWAKLGPNGSAFFRVCGQARILKVFRRLWFPL